jgi:hypothetical protein
MAFRIVEIIDSKPENMLANVIHEDYLLTATIRAEKSADLIAEKLFQAEIDYDEVMGWKVVDDFDDDQSGIWQEQDGIHLLGRIHNVLDYGDGKTVVDVYVQKGPEFFTVTADGMDDPTFDATTGLEIVVKTLYLHPTL